MYQWLKHHKLQKLNKEFTKNMMISSSLKSMVARDAWLVYDAKVSTEECHKLAGAPLDGGGIQTSSSAWRDSWERDRGNLPFRLPLLLLGKDSVVSVSENCLSSPEESSKFGLKISMSFWSIKIIPTVTYRLFDSSAHSQWVKCICVSLQYMLSYTVHLEPVSELDVITLLMRNPCLSGPTGTTDKA